IRDFHVTGVQTCALPICGIVPTEAEAGLNNLFASFFGFAYFDSAEAETLQLPENPNVISITLPPGTDLERAEAEFYSLRIPGHRSEERRVGKEWRCRCAP